MNWKCNKGRRQCSTRAVRLFSHEPPICISGGSVLSKMDSEITAALSKMDGEKLIKHVQELASPEVSSSSLQVHFLVMWQWLYFSNYFFQFSEVWWTLSQHWRRRKNDEILSQRIYWGMWDFLKTISGSSLSFLLDWCDSWKPTKC